jgi:fumarate reductase flavoprotein subunit
MNGKLTQADVLVIGSGASGLAAALTAVEGGAKVIVFEKQRSLGGTSNFFKGTFAVESDMQKAEYVNYSRDEAFKNIIEYSHWRANPRLVRAIVNESSGTISWLQKEGVEFSDVKINLADSYRTYHLIKGEGAAVVKILATRAKDQGVDIRLTTPVTRIIKESNRITGVNVEENGEDVLVKSKAVIIASGGYANNKEWVKKYSGFDLGNNLLPVGNVDKMGDGIRMAWEVGAAEEGIGTMEFFRIGPIQQDLGRSGMVSVIIIQPDLWVNQAGERFCDEGTTFYDTSEGNANARHKEGYTYSLFDDSIIRRLMEDGITKGITPETLPGQKMPEIDTQLKAALENAPTEIFEANSVEELAQKIGIAPDVLRNTVDEYNRFCAKGHDDLFVKDPRYLWPLTGPKFYAGKARTVFLGTMGGIKINQRMEVIDKKEIVIPGLYAAGYDAGGMYGHDYCMKVASGLSSAFAINSGRLAGKNVLKFLGR